MTSTMPKQAVVAHVRGSWRKSAEQRAAQAWRFARIALAALTTQVLAQLAANGFDGVTHLDQKAVVALVVGAVEAAWRQLHPAMTASAVIDATPPLPAADPATTPDAPDDTLDVSTIPTDLP